LLCAHVALGLALAALAAVVTGRFAAALSTVVGAAGVFLLFGHDDPFARVHPRFRFDPTENVDHPSGYESHRRAAAAWSLRTAPTRPGIERRASPRSES
jgi:hypothetical protein